MILRTREPRGYVRKWHGLLVPGVRPRPIAPCWPRIIPLQAVISEALTPATDNVSGTSDTLQFGASVPAQALLIGCVRTGDTTNPTLSMSDDINGSWSTDPSVEHSRAAHGKCQIFWFANSGAGTPTVTFSQPNSSTIRWSIHAYSGAHLTAPFHVGNNAGGAGNPTAGHDITTTEADCLILAACGLNSGMTVTADTGYTLVAEVPGAGATRLAAQHLISTGTGTFDSVFGFNTSVDWIVVQAAFKPAAAGGGGGKPWHYQRLMRHARA